MKTSYWEYDFCQNEHPCSMKIPIPFNEDTGNVIFILPLFNEDLGARTRSTGLFNEDLPSFNEETLDLSKNQVPFNEEYRLVQRRIATGADRIGNLCYPLRPFGRLQT
jgi:hypothetical protein